jgi:hypothetical protein
MVYDGRGNRLQAIAHAAGSTITATYTLDPGSGLPLLVDNGINVTMILYGQAAIGEYVAQTAEWTYYLGDAQLSVRQLVDAAGTVTKVQTYGPYGVLLHQAGDAGGLFGYKGGQSGANGLWYFGDGYFDPATGQFLSANGKPLLPLAAAAMANPAGLLFGSVLFISWRKRKGKKGVRPTTFLLLGVLLAVGLSGCVEGGATGTPEAPIISPTGTPIPMPTVMVTEVQTATSTATVVSITATPTCTPTPIALPTMTIFFGGSGGQAQIQGDGPDPAVQTPVWYEIADRSYQYKGSKNSHAQDAINDIADYENKNLLVIGYSSGADTALIFAEQYYQHKDANMTQGNITGIALLGSTMTDPNHVLDTSNHWMEIMDDLLLVRGAKVYALNDNSIYDDILADYSSRPGASLATYWYDERDKAHYNDYHDPTSYGYQQGWPPEGTNNDPGFRDEVMSWLQN